MNVLDRFARWFSSGPGVYQTAVLTLAVVVVELIDRNLDPHAFILMAVLTVYSAVTQPALAYSGAIQAHQMEAMIAHLEALLEHHGIDPK